MENRFLIFCRRAYECNNSFLPKFTKEQLDNAEDNHGFIGTIICNGIPIDYFLQLNLTKDGN